MVERILTEADMQNIVGKTFGIRMLAEALTTAEEVDDLVYLNNAMDSTVTKVLEGRETDIFRRLLIESQRAGAVPKYRPSLTTAYIRRILVPLHLRAAPKMLESGAPSACVAVADYGLGMYGVLRDFVDDQPLTRRQFEELHTRSTRVTRSAYNMQPSHLDDQASAQAADDYEHLIHLLNADPSGFQAVDFALTVLKQDPLHTPLFSRHFILGAAAGVDHYKRLFPHTAGLVQERPLR